MLRKHVIVFFSFLICNLAYAQNEYFGTLNCQSLAFNRIAPIPSVKWLIDDKPAYDQQNKRFYFMGNTSAVAPWYLYTIDATTGAALSKVICPANYDYTNNIYGLQFDNKSGKLYALNLSNSTGNAYFSSIDPTTGNVSAIGPIPKFSGYGYTLSAFSSKNQTYFFGGDDSLGLPAVIAINSANGKVIWESESAGRVYNIAFDNKNGKLYGIEITASQKIQFDSIELSTGLPHKISSLPDAGGIYQIPTTTIDEDNGRYIFLGEDTTPCISNRLYILDVNNGQILSDQFYPYAEQTGNPDYENVLSFSFDNNAGVLYALNWHVADSIRGDRVHISASADSTCPGDLITFNSAIPIVFQGPRYQWYVNSSPAGIDARNFNSNKLSDGDTIYCIVTDTLPCDQGLTDTSNKIIVYVRNPVDSQFNITASTNDICQGDPVLFIAHTNANPDSLTWKINGNNAGHGDSLLINSLTNGDQVSCTETNGNGCTLPVNSGDTIVMNVMETPSITFSPDTIFLNAGSSQQLMPYVTGPAQDYSWSPSAGLSDTTIADPVASPSHDTRYYLTAGLPEGCFSTASVLIKVIYPDTVNCLNFKNVKAFPNPASDKVLISFGAVWKSGVIIVYNAIGQRVSAIKVEDKDRIYLYKDHLASGVYTLKFICSQTIAGTLPVIFAN